MFKALQWEDWAGIAIGAWMLISPWVLGFSDHQAATMNALIAGTILVLEEMLELGVHEMVEEWMDLAVGLWLIVSPAVLGFGSLTAASVSAITAGLLTVLLAAWAMSPLDQRVERWWHEHVTGH